MTTERTTTTDNWLDDPYPSRAFQRVREFAPSARIANDSGVVSELPVDLQDLGGIELKAVDGSTTTVERQFATSNGEGLVVLKDGVIVYEQYANGMLPRTPHLCMSVTKSFVGAMLGSLSGGWLSGKLIQRGWSADKARKLAITLGCVIMLPALLLTATASTPLYAVLLIAAILFGFQVAINNIQTLPSDWFGGGAVGSLAGISGTAAVAGTLVTTWLVPAMTKVSFAPIFILGAALVPLSLLCIWLGGRIEPVQPKTEE